MNFSERANKIAELVIDEKVTRIADVGCDHGFNSYKLLLSNAVSYVHLIDISKRNLNKAKTLLEKDFADKIACSVCDGLSVVKDDELELAIITGMGANEIISILQASKLDITFVLGPMRNTYELRSFLNSNDFEIKKDFVSFLDGRFYDFIVCKRGNQTLSERELLFGKTNLENVTNDFVMYLKHNIVVAKDILKSIVEESEKYLLLSNYIKKSKEIIDAYS